MHHSLRSWRLKKAGIVWLLVAVSAAGAASLYVGQKLFLVPVLLILLAIWVCGRGIYACPHCKAPLDLRLPLRADLKCTKCGKSIVDESDPI